MISLFVRSYPADFGWLEYSIRSMNKNLTGIDESVLVVPYGSIVPSLAEQFFDKIIYGTETFGGYIQQQIDKVAAHRCCGGDYILYSDSDCIFYEPFDAANDRLDSDGRVILPKTSYASKNVGQAVCWKAITMGATGIVPEWEYMRCFPILHHRDVVFHLDHSSRFHQYARAAIGTQLSEFNAMGVIAETFYSHLYRFVDTDNSSELIKHAKQYWSWGGMTSEIIEELNAL